MKLDKETIIAIVICMALILGWPFIVKKIWPGNPNPIVKNIPTTNQVDTSETTKKAPIEKIKPENTEVVVKQPATEPKDPVKDPENTDPKPIIPEVKIKKVASIFLENEFIVAEINPNKGNITSIKMKEYFTNIKDGNKTKKSDENIVLFKNVEKGALGISSEDNSWILTDTEGKLENANTPEEAVKVKRTLKTAKGQAFSVTQKWSIEANYIIKSSIEITNLSNAPLSLTEVNLSAGGIPKITELAGDQVFREDFQVAYFDVEGNKVIGVNAVVGSGIIDKITGNSKPDAGIDEKVTNEAKWVGVVNKYFTCILLPKEHFQDGLLEKGVVLKNDKKKDYIMAEAIALLDFKDIAPGTSKNRDVRYYAGPKKLKLLKDFEPTSAKIMKLYILGASFLEFISVGFLYMLNWLKDWCGSYGLSIILLTLIVKTVFWPITHRANVSMRKMQKIQPLIKELRKKYKDKPQQMNMEMMKLYKEHKVNPLGGCLPIVMQMPVFFALYATFSGSIAPRHTSFLWMHDLSMPDTVASIFSVPINPLMLMMTGTMVLQQKLTPSAADPAQQKMMMFMPLVMLLMLYSLPSGLTLYWTVSQFISVTQLIVNKQLEKRAEMKEADLK